MWKLASKHIIIQHLMIASDPLSSASSRLIFLYRLCRLILTLATNIGLSRVNRSEKFVLLDPIEQHSHLHTLLEDNLLVYTSIYDCCNELTSNQLNDYTLFLSLVTFQVHLFELNWLSNVSFAIFNEDNDQSHPTHISRRMSFRTSSTWYYPKLYSTGLYVSSSRFRRWSW
jgi:hypothetical protein